MHEFFYNQPNGTIEANDIFKCNTDADEDDDQIYSHACVITGENKKAYRVKNSWGDEFANEGSFYIKKDAMGKMLKFHYIYHSK